MIHDKNKFSGSDKVRVVKLYSHDSIEECTSYDNQWTADMDKELKIGDILSVALSNEQGIYVNQTQFGWPSSCFELYVEEAVTPIQKEIDPGKVYAIWNYDQYPFALSSEIDTLNNEFVTVYGYGGMRLMRDNIIIVDFDPGPIIEELRSQLNREIKKVQDEFNKKALAAIPKLKNLKAYKNV